MRIEYLADNPSFLETLARWHHEEWSHFDPADTLQKRIGRMQAHLGRLQIPTTFVALDGDAVLGSAALVADDMHRLRDLTPWLASVFVTPEHRNRGVGSAVVRRVVEEAQALGVERLYLFTPDRERLYARLGWSVSERTEYMGLSVVIMELPLKH